MITCVHRLLARTPQRINAIQRYFVDRTRLGIPIIPFEEAVHGFVRDGATMFPQAIALAATWDTTSHGASRGRDRTRDAVARRSAGAVAGDQHRERRALGSRRGDVRRGSVSDVGDGPRVHRAVRARGRHRDAEALRRERRRGWAGQLSDRGQRADARGAVLSAVQRRDSWRWRALGDDRVQLRGRVAGDAESRAAQREAEGRLGLQRLRHLRRGGDGRRDGAAPHRGEHGDGDEERARGRARRHLPVVVAAASSVSRRVRARPDRRFGDRRARQRACCTRSSSSGCSSSRTSTRTARRTGTGTPIIARWRSRRRARRSCCCGTSVGTLPLSPRTRSIAVIGTDAVGSAARRIQRAGESPRCRFSTVFARGSRAEAVSFATRQGRVASRGITSSFQRRNSPRAHRTGRRPDCRRVLRQQSSGRRSRALGAPTRRSTSAGRSTRPRAGFRSTGTRCAGRGRSPCRQAACDGSASKATTAIDCRSTTRS